MPRRQSERLHALVHESDSRPPEGSL
jgi:hypothetical protein